MKSGTLKRNPSQIRHHEPMARFQIASLAPYMGPRANNHYFPRFNLTFSTIHANSFFILQLLKDPYQYILQKFHPIEYNYRSILQRLIFLKAQTKENHNQFNYNQ